MSTYTTAELLEAVRAFVARFVRAPEAALDVAAAWTLHTWAVDASATTPYLHVTGPSMRCGKSRCLETLRLLAARPLAAANATPAALFRSLAADPPPSIFLDEVDAIFARRSGSDSGAEDLRALLNAGNRKGTPALRCVGQGAALEVRAFPVFGPKILAGIGDIPPTLADRSLRIRLERLAPGERVERLVESEAVPEAEAIRERLAAWAEAAVPVLRDARPELPEELDDRAADACLPLLAIGDLVGEPWASRLRAAAVALRRGDDGEREPAVRLLDALARIFAEAGFPDSLPTAELVAALAADEEAPGGFEADNVDRSGRRLAATLRRFRVRSRDLRVEGRALKGYRWADLEPVIERYGASSPREKSDKSDNPHGYAEKSATESATEARPSLFPSRLEPAWLSRCRSCRALRAGESTKTPPVSAAPASRAPSAAPTSRGTSPRRSATTG